MGTTKGTRKGLRLTHPGASNAPHDVRGLPGFYWIDLGTPIGLPGCPTEAQAEAAAKDKGCPVELVDITDKDLKEYRYRCTELRGADAMKAFAMAMSQGGIEGDVAREQAAKAAGKDE